MSTNAPNPDHDVQAPPLRRNRRRPACEVCRKQKLACDHILPVCSRCVRRGLSDECFYHPSPMKKEGPRKLRASRSLMEQRASSSTAPEYDLPTPTMTPATALFPEDEETSNIPSTLFTDNHTGPRGPSRPSAIFAENQADLGSGLWEAETEISDHDYADNRKAPSSHGTYEDVQLGIKILQALPSHVRCNELLERYFTAFHPMDPILHRPTIETWHQGLWGSFAEHLGERRNPEELDTIAQTICKNQLNGTNSEIRRGYQKWVVAFTGPHLRWETVGIIFAVCGMSCMTYPAWAYIRDPIVKNMARDTFATQMLSCTRDCFHLCEVFGGVNDLRVYLIYLLLSLRFMCGEEGLFVLACLLILF